MPTIAHRYHDFSYGHRVHGHESKCAHIHGHNGRVTFHCEAPHGLDSVGRVIDFSDMKIFCNWIEDNWDHKFLAYEHDPYMKQLYSVSQQRLFNRQSDAETLMAESIVWVPFNPTAENMADYLLRTIGPELFHNKGIVVTRVDLMETRKCGVTVTL